jgi:hypothetical protein
LQPTNQEWDLHGKTVAKATERKLLEKKRKTGARNSGNGKQTKHSLLLLSNSVASS